VIEEDEDRTACDLYAYFMLPVAFEEDGKMRDFNTEERDAIAAAEKGVEPLPAGFVCLGWDIVNNSMGWSYWPQFECSPLTCSGLANEVATNRYGLIDELDCAIAVAPRIVEGPSEPGTYYLVQVWRKARNDQGR
jgi:hypothetical protein